ncbi:hypothetical protein HELRODRAFT_90723, partial [Helobdella robusta]|uniref:long-chain-fatty-acid--CoA ligase n=1 Tax=Helobdella robusta TaxID=6412 RepID=T1G7V1_HELRO
LFTWKADQAVKIRLGDVSPTDMEPISIVTAFRRTVEKHGERDALCHKENGAWVKMTYNQYYTVVLKMAKIFIRLGLESHHGVGIIGFNSPEWFISNFAAIFAGGISCGIYTTNSAELCLYVANSANCQIIVVENDIQLQKFLSVSDQLTDVRAIIQYKGQLKEKYDNVYLWSELMKMELSEEDDEALNNRIKNIAPNKCCSLIYTSGTTGPPKGAMLSHDNLTWSARVLSISEGTSCEEVGVTYLPLSHIAAQMIDIYSSLIVGSSVYFAQPDALKGTLKDTIKEVRPTIFMGVPRVWEKMHEAMLVVGRKNGVFKRNVIKMAKKVGLWKAHGNCCTSCMYGLANKLVFTKVKEALGFNRCHFLITGAAPIMKETMEFFYSLNLPIREAYGLSECTAAHTLTPKNHLILGSVGMAYSGVQTYLDNPDSDGCGEVCMVGRHVFMGYLNEEAKTRETLDAEGRLHTGDIGKMDGRGCLFITGRIKELIITSGGENVAPVPIEERVKETLKCVSNCMLLGDRRRFLSLLITFKCEVNLDTLEPLDQLSQPAIDWCHSIGSEAKYVKDVLDNKDEKVKKAIDDGRIAQVNLQAPSNAQKIQKWTILPADFSIPGGELGPTLKLKRPDVLKKYGDLIEKFYSFPGEN